MDDEQQPGEDEAVIEGEVVDGLPVIAEVRALDSAPAPILPALQTAAAAATGFLAGAATLALLHRRNTRRLPAAGRQFRPVGPPPAGTHRTYLVHVISRPLD